MISCCPCCVQVRESEYTVIERFGKYDRILSPGCYCYNCCFETPAYTKSLKLMTHDMQCETVTKESLSVVIKISVQYKVRTPQDRVPDVGNFESSNLTVDTGNSIESQRRGEDAQNHHELVSANSNPMYKAVYSCNDVVTQIRQLIEGYIRSVSRDFTLLEMFQSKNLVSDGIFNMLTREITPFGYLIHRVIIGDIDPPPSVKASMNQVLESQNRRDALVNQAEAEKTASILRAEGAYQVKKLDGEAIAAQRKAIVDGLREISHKDGHEPDSKELTTVMVLMQYLDVLNNAALNGRNTFILPSSPANITNIENDLNNAMRTNIITGNHLNEQPHPPSQSSSSSHSSKSTSTRHLHKQSI